ncbi:MAG: regulatory protein RecX [Phycisphaerales bacterium]|nr:regulatory protein RecX [Phycisphaerales bacterium]
MEGNPRHSAARRRVDEQIARLDGLAPDATVTALRPTGEDAARFNLKVGRVQVGPIHADDVQQLGLRVGLPIDGAVLSALGAALAREAARADAMRLLRARPRSKMDLVRRLTIKGHEREHAGAAADRLERAGLINDEALAATRAENLAETGKAAPRAAEVKLRALGLASPVATKAVREAFQGLDLVAQATEAARKRVRALGPAIDEATRRRRVWGYLARRGYDHETCRRALDDALGEHTGD